MIDSYACPCGTVTTAIEARIVGGPSFVEPVEHCAPCGMPCLEGGISIKAQKSGEYHDTRKPCRKCAARRNGR